MRFKLGFIFLLLTLFVFLGCDKKEQTDDNVPAKSTQAVKNIIVKDVHNHTYSIAPLENGVLVDDAKGKIVLLDFFTTWCAPCRAMIPHMNRIAKRYKADLGVYGVLMEEGKSNEEIESFKKYMNIKYPIFNSKENSALADAVGGVNTIPLLILFDGEGNYIQHYMGMVSAKMIEKDIKKALKQQKSSH